VTRRQRIADLTTFALPSQPTLSPDGREVVYVLTTVDAAGDKNVTSLWRAGASVGPGAGPDGHRPEPRQLTRGEADSSPAWSPDGSKIAFLRADGGPAQLWLLAADGGEPEQVTTLPLGAGAPVWSPDGTRIAFGAPVDLRAGPGEDDAARAKRAAAPVVTARLDYKADGAGLLRTMRNHLHVVDLASGMVRQVTEGDWHAGSPVWSPDSARLAFGAATAPDADLAYRAPVYVTDVSGPFAKPVFVGLADGIGVPAAWTPDGSALIVVGTTAVPYGHLRLLRLSLPAAGPADPAGSVIDLAGSLDRNVMPGGPGYPGGLPALAGDGATVVFCVRDQGCSHVYAVPADGSGTPRPVVGGAGRVVSGLSVSSTGSSGTGTAAVALATPDSYGEIVVVELGSGAETVITGHGASQHGASQHGASQHGASQHGASREDVKLYLRQEREFAISDGGTVQGWLIRDPDAAGPGPVLLDVHGGPHNAWNGAADPAHLYHQVLAERGWTVLIVNPRASDGYGEAFYAATAGAWGVSDALDFLEPLDALVAEGIADPARLAVTGYSYGGYMTCYLTSRDGRFAAAVAGGCVSDLRSMAGTSDQGHGLSDHEWGFKSPAGRDFSPSDPMARVTDVRTPTLLLHGGADLRCPVGQAEQWHVALRELGIDTQLVRYPGASHLFILDGTPSHRIDYNQRVVDWVEQYASETRRPKIDAGHWERRLAVLAERHKVPGASLGILRLGTPPNQHGGGRPDEVIEAAYGYANFPAKIEATTDTLFQIGSMSKVWTATLAMQLVDEGKLDLDAPVADVLPELRLADAEVAKTVTMRHLLNHTSGIDGDVFTDTGRGDDCVEKYVALLSGQKQNHPLGATWSYCNAGFVLAGRVIEKLTGLTWDAALRQKIYAPLGLKHTVTLAEEALLFRTAAGHVDVTGDPALAPVWQLPRSLGPAGLICSTPADVLAFARMHLAGGLAPDGTRVLSAESTEAMTQLEADLPDKYSLGDSWGIGWIRFGWDSRRLVGHDGNTIGQAAFLRVLPEAGLAVTLLTNGGHARDMYYELYREIFAELAGVDMPAAIEPPPISAQEGPVEADITPHVGTYERAGVVMEVMADSEKHEGPTLRTTVTGPIAEMVPDPVDEYAMTPVGPDLWLVRQPGTQTWAPVTFYALPTGEKYLHFGVRATPKV
jgi:dipeptidyl aminopeptidase/acylaminoacyl peptidase/CubicO group peptidase (beta-lactamase class C family)